MVWPRFCPQSKRTNMLVSLLCWPLDWMWLRRTFWPFESGSLWFFWKIFLHSDAYFDFICYIKYFGIIFALWILSCREHDQLYRDICVSRNSTCKLYVCSFIFCFCWCFIKPDSLITFGSPYNYAFVLPYSHPWLLIWMFVQAYNANVICPNKHQAEQEKFYKNRLLESETYIGGHVECLESGVFRSDLPTKFQLDPSGYEVIGLSICKSSLTAVSFSRNWYSLNEVNNWYSWGEE